MTEYKEPELTITCLDYCKPIETRLLLESIKHHIKFPVKVILVDNGSNEDYSYKFLKEGLLDQLIVNKESLGLGLGTRDAINACQSEFCAYIQNDQVFCRDLTQDHFNGIKTLFGQRDLRDAEVKTVSLAGYPCGVGVYSERAQIFPTKFYKDLEPLSPGGAGFLHHLPWREGEIQEIYKKNNWLHYATPAQFVADNGVFAVRDMGDCGVYCHRTDSKAAWVIVPPKNRNPAYPKVNEAEFELMRQGKWEDGRIPEQEIPHSFDCWSNTELGRMEKEYIDNLRERFKGKINGN